MPTTTGNKTDRLLTETIHDHLQKHLPDGHLITLATNNNRTKQIRIEITTTTPPNNFPRNIEIQASIYCSHVNVAQYLDYGRKRHKFNLNCINLADPNYLQEINTTIIKLLTQK